MDPPLIGVTPPTHVRAPTPQYPNLSTTPTNGSAFKAASREDIGAEPVVELDYEKVGEVVLPEETPRSVRGSDCESPEPPKLPPPPERTDWKGKRGGYAHESLDYVQTESQAFRFHQTKSVRSKRERREEIIRWGITFFIGISVGGMAYALREIVDRIYDLKFSWVRPYIQPGKSPLNLLEPQVPSQNHMLPVGFIIFLSCNLFLNAIGSCLVVFWAPAANGSGIPDVKGYLNGCHIANAFNIKTLVVKFVGVAASVGSSLAVGPEGPMIHLGAMIGGGLGELRSRTLKCELPLMGMLRNSLDRRDFITIGAAAGVSAAFSAPIGGVLFALEEASSFWSPSLTWKSFFSALLSNLMIDVLFAINNGDVFLPSADLLFPQKPNPNGYAIWEYLPFAILGLIGGLTGALFTHINLKLSDFRLNRLFKYKWLRISEVTLIVTVTSAIIFYFPMLWPCKFAPAHPADASSDTVQFNCKEGHYNEMSTLIWAPQEVAVARLLSRDTNSLLGPLTSAAAFVLYFSLAVWTAGSSFSSGLVVPMLLVGGCYGRWLAALINIWFDTNLDPGTYALIGSASFIGGVSRMTIAMTIILTEITGDAHSVLPIMMVIMISKGVGDQFTHPLYDALLHLRHVPYLEVSPPKYSEIMPIRTVMSSPVVCIRMEESIATLMDVLRNTPHNGFPVLHPDTGTFVGLILRNHLIVLIEQMLTLNRSTLDWEEFSAAVDTAHMARLDLHDLETLIEEADEPTAILKRIDLGKHMNLGAKAVYETYTVGTVFRMIRTMGLRHVIIVDHRNRVKGIATRKDVIDDVVAKVYKGKIYEIHHDDPLDSFLPEADEDTQRRSWGPSGGGTSPRVSYRSVGMSPRIGSYTRGGTPRG